MQRLRALKLLTVTAIAEVMECARSTVNRNSVEYLKSHPKKNRTVPIACKKKLEERRKLIHNTLVSLRKEGTGCPSVEQIVRVFNVRTIRQRHGIHVTKAIVTGDLHSLGFCNFARPASFTQRDQDPEKRVSYCLSDLPLAQNIIFSDEKWFDVNDHGTRREWRRRSERPTVRNYGGRYVAKCHVWGAIGVNFRMLVLHDASVNSEVYVKKCIKPLKAKMRRENLLATHHLMQDNARCHTSRYSMEWIQSLGINLVGGVSARSPDMNPIENAWAILARAVSDRGPQNKDELWRFIKEEWDNIPVDVMNNLVLSFDKRRADCVAAKGAPIR
jgi:hypothetical protein